MKSPENLIKTEGLGELNIESAKAEQSIELPKLSPAEELNFVDAEIQKRRQEVDMITRSTEDTRVKLSAVREELGLAPTEEDPPSILSGKEKLEEIQAEQKELEKQKEELISKQEREQLIKEEKEKILQEKLDELFKEFEGFNPGDFESILKSGKTTEGRNVESKSMGSLNPEDAQSLAKAFKEGIKLLPKLIEVLPDLLKKFDEDLTKEATERVDKKIEEEKQKMEEGKEKENKPEAANPEALGDKIPSDTPNSIKEVQPEKL